MKKPTFFSRWGLLILCVLFFLTPFALRGARMAMQRMSNRMKDWLPADFTETADLEWFGRHFAGEQFVVVTWPGCTADDPRFQKLADKLRHEVVTTLPPRGSQEAGGEASSADPAGQAKPYRELSGEEHAALEVHRAHEIGDRLGLASAGKQYQDWGGKGEKWLRGERDSWYFITPAGELYRWTGRNNMVSALIRAFRRNVLGQREAEGEFVAQVGRPPHPGQTNAFFDDPSRLNARLFKSIMTGPDTLQQLSRKDGPLWPRGVDDEFAAEEARAKATERLTGTLFGPDGKQTCMVLTLSEPGKRELKRVLGRPLLGRPPGRLLELAASECGISPEYLKLGGPPVDNVAIDEEGQVTLVRLICLCAIVGIVLGFLSVRSFKVTFVLFFIGGVGAFGSLAIVFWTGGTVDSILMSMPSMVYVLGMSGTLHLYNYYRETVEEQGPEGAAEKMLSLGWKASFLCAISNSLGLVSLYTSDLSPIRNFGVYTAVGVMATLVLMWTFLPAALETWPPKIRQRPHGTPASNERTAFSQRLDRFWEKVGAFILRRWGWVTVGCCLIIGVGCLGIPRIRTSVHLIKFFDRDAKIIRDYTWLENHLAKLVPMELVVRVQPHMLRSVKPSAATAKPTADGTRREGNFPLDFLERMEIASRIQQVVEREFGQQGKDIVGRAMCVPTLAPELPPPGITTVRNPVRSVMNRKLEEHRDEYLASDYLKVDTDDKFQGSELWRISLRIGALREIDYGRFVSELKRVVEPVLTAYQYREQILRELDAHSDDRGVVKSRVAFLGVSDPAARTVAKTVQTPQPRASAPGTVTHFIEEDTTSAAEVDQTAIFAGTLQDVLTCAGVYAKKNCWHNPAEVAQERAYYTSQAWAETLRKDFDCVVLVKDNPAYDVDFIRQQARVFIDARDHWFNPAVTTQAQTAVERAAPIHVVYTGAVPLVYKAQRSLLESLIQSTFWAFVTITPLIIWLARSIGGGLVAMLPNALPVVIVFGGLCWLGVDVDVGSMMTASIALGVAVDDTIHFLTWFRDDLDRLGDRNQAILAAYKRCATPTLQAAFISGLGLSVFALSTFTPTQRFGYLMLTILIAGVIAELVLYPALLAGPLGRFCVARKGKRSWWVGILEMLHLRHPETTDRAPTQPPAPAASESVPLPHLGERAAGARDGAHFRVDKPHSRRRR